MIVEVDVDGTLCTGTGGGNYAAAKPRREMIHRVNQAHDRGDEIIIRTARGCMTGKDWIPLTKKQLRAWGVKFHSVKQRPEHYDRRIDDKAWQPWEDDYVPRHTYMIGYGFWNRRDQVFWAMDGIAEYCGKASMVCATFDACKDNSEDIFDGTCGLTLEKTPTKKIPIRGKDEIGIHNTIMREFLQSGLDALIVMHDDQRFAGLTFPILDDILDEYGRTLGIVGGRAGYEVGVSKVIGSRWSAAHHRDQLLPGTWTERPYVNTGPIVYPRATVERIGYLDEQFEHWFIWEDYAARCAVHKLKTVVADIPVRHTKFGTGPLRVTCSYYNDGSHRRDHERMKKKWPRLGW